MKYPYSRRKERNLLNFIMESFIAKNWGKPTKWGHTVRSQFSFLNIHIMYKFIICYKCSQQKFEKSVKKKRYNLSCFPGELKLSESLFLHGGPMQIWWQNLDFWPLTPHLQMNRIPKEALMMVTSNLISRWTRFSIRKYGRRDGPCP